MNESKTQLRRYNIYSCLTIRTANLEICFDPAKIRDEDLEKINPDYIFISHESMDHMDPTQVYILQKKKNCKIYCSIASAVDLIQQFPYDTEFIGKINPLVPGCTITNKDLIIETQKSLHCDYMLPLVYKISIKKDKISVLHCFDSFISDKIIDLSKDTSMAIVPIGIAKGVSINSGIEFLEKLKSKRFMTNHFKSHEDLENFKGLINNDNRFIYMNWDESKEVNLEQVEIKKDNYELEEVNFILDKTYIAGSNTYKAILSNINNLKCEIINNKEILNKIFDTYKNADVETKKVLLIIYTVLSLWDINLIKEEVFEEIKKDLKLESDNSNNNLQTIILFFLSIYAQQSGEVKFLEEAMKIGSVEKEHNEYWVVEYLGRCLVSQKKTPKSIEEKLLKVISVPEIYNSVVVRRKIFWELYRIMKVIPTLTKDFVNIFEDGLTDSNPDVELLATLCFGLANNIQKLTKQQLDKIFNLLKDDEDDVRETAVRIARGLNHKDYIKENKDKLLELINDTNCHVRHQAELTKKFIEEME